ncbi:hypothetical protein HMPREF1487_04377 [Pseudomonas sp. HPB0071]|uniref:DUF1654 domain-containing protein n=1 Tax=unclassified Pseudomonas TaxID=196821 RepID=UPI0002CC6EFC|nr:MULTISPECIES: DUF1654 domain-containing protein [unclassified Pseudomonas]ENA37459.1 hypothetical protein HMPREF1487_04377 [Pseudomonas sp. HPB0071]
MPKAASPVVSAQERLAIRISNMINTPKAQMQRRVVIHRLDSEPDEAWEGVLEMLRETDGLDMELNDNCAVTLSWLPR